MLKWLYENGCPWDEWRCAYAAEGGHLEMLKWLHENGCPWDEWSCAYVAGEGHLEVLKWLSGDLYILRVQICNAWVRRDMPTVRQ